MKPGPFVSSAATITVLCALAVVAVRAAEVPMFAGRAKTLLERRGLPMTQQQAFERITFRPLIPTPSYLEVALLPAFHGDDKDHPENRGIGYEYVQRDRTWMLQEWPRAGGSLERYPVLPNAGPCKDTHVIVGSVRHPRALAWETASLVFALQPDGRADERDLRTEWARLVKRGACR